MGNDLFGSIDEIGKFSQRFSTKNRNGHSNKVGFTLSFGFMQDVFVRCHLGGMMYDLWESLLLESDIESQVNEPLEQ